jgi:hypothetical protein
MRCAVDDPILCLNAVGGRQPPPRARSPGRRAVHYLGDGRRARAEFPQELNPVGGVHRRIGVAVKNDQRPLGRGGAIVTIGELRTSPPLATLHRCKG